MRSLPTIKALAFQLSVIVESRPAGREPSRTSSKFQLVAIATTNLAQPMTINGHIHHRQQHDTSAMKTISRISLLFLAALIYSYFRYAFFTPENLVNLPVFVSNKGLAMAAALSFSMAFLEQWLGHSAEALTWFRAGTWGSVIHIPMTLSILRPSYFHEFFIGERLSLNGESVILFGTLTAGGIYLLTRQHLSADQRWWLSMATMLTLASHTFFMGMARGVKVSSSQAYLPPMWLLSLIGVILGIGFLALAHPFKPQPEGESGHHI